MVRWGNHSDCRRSFESARKDLEKMTRNNGGQTESLADEIRRQFGAEATTRFLRALPAFRTEAGHSRSFQGTARPLDGVEGAPTVTAGNGGKDRLHRATVTHSNFDVICVKLALAAPVLRSMSS